MLTRTPAAISEPKPSVVQDRYLFLDGLRGLFSVVVLFFHVFFYFNVDLFPLYTRFGIIFDGTVAVKVFFVVSGFSLTLNYFKYLEQRRADADNVIKRMAAARYFRLAIPSLAACLIMLLIYRSGLNYYAKIPENLKPEWWSWAYRDQSVGLFATLKYALYDVFFPGAFIPVVQYKGIYLITNLWTMSIEFVGSIMVFVYALVVRDFRYRAILSAAMTLFFAANGSFYAYFFSGVLAADLFLKAEKLKLPTWAEVLNILVIAFLFVRTWPGIEFAHLVLSSLLVGCVAFGRLTRNVFGSRLFEYLGKISFSLYLIHIPIIVSVESYIFLHYSETIPRLQLVLVSGTVVVVLSFIAAHLFAYVDRYSVVLSRRIGKMMVAERQ